MWLVHCRRGPFLVDFAQQFDECRFIPNYADQGDHLTLKPSWTKGGRARVIPIRTKEQREVLGRARKLAGRGSLIPANRNYKQQLRIYEGHTQRAGLSKMHGLRHAYVQRREQRVLGQMNKNPTYFGLLAEFGESEIPLDRVCEKYFGLSVPKAKRRACLQQLPIPPYRAGSQKSPWLISAIDLAQHIDEQRSIAAKQWANMN